MWLSISKILEGIGKILGGLQIIINTAVYSRRSKWSWSLDSGVYGRRVDVCISLRLLGALLTLTADKMHIRLMLYVYSLLGWVLHIYITRAKWPILSSFVIVTSRNFAVEAYSHDRERYNENKIEGIIVAVDCMAVALNIAAVRELKSVSDNEAERKTRMCGSVSLSKLNGT